MYLLVYLCTCLFTSVPTPACALYCVYLCSLVYLLQLVLDIVCTYLLVYLCTYLFTCVPACLLVYLLQLVLDRKQVLFRLLSFSQLAVQVLDVAVDCSNLPSVIAITILILDCQF